MNLSVTFENKKCHAEFSSASRFSLLCEILKEVQDDMPVKFQIFLVRF